MLTGRARRTKAAGGFGGTDAGAKSGPMCGRYIFKLSCDEIVARYRLTLPEELPET